MKKSLFCDSLGCPKNRVDSEVVISQFSENGWKLSESPEDADLIILNTCSFINDARRESVDRFFELYSSLKKGAKIAVMGCLPQLYPNLGKILREADFIFGINSIPKALELVETRWERGFKDKITPSNFLYDSSYGRVLTYSPYTAYLKIADGCDNFCSYCLIPRIRGNYRERDLNDILKEAEKLISGGVKELAIVAQDTTQYGSKNGSSLKKLLESINGLKGDFRFRVVYLYPSGIDRELLELIRDLDKMHNYLEIPIQHISDRVLKAMNRRYTTDDIYNLIDEIRDVFLENYLLRTTLISSFPAEKREDHKMLESFVNEALFDYVGVFKYSKEKFTASAKLRGIPFVAAEKRFAEIERAAYESMERRLDRFIGVECEVLYEGIDPDLKTPVGRCWFQAPEIDGVAIIANLKNQERGNYFKCRIASREGADFIAEII